MSAVVADTHAAVWYVTQPDKLSKPAESALDQATAIGDPIYLSSISLIEVQYLVDKAKLPQAVLDRLIQAIQGAAPGFVLSPVDQNVALRLHQVPRAQVPDMPDRIIAATALTLNLPLVTRDRKIQASGVTSIW